MNQRFIVVGDTTTHGGTIGEGIFTLMVQGECKRNGVVMDSGRRFTAAARCSWRCANGAGDHPGFLATLKPTKLSGKNRSEAEPAPLTSVDKYNNRQ